MEARRRKADMNMKQWIEINSVIPLDAPTINEFADQVREWTKEFPDICEGVQILMGIECFFTYKVESDRVVVNVIPRDQIEPMLNEIGLSTHEPWSPLPGRSDRQWGKPKLAG
jgi:hypothetical protein